EQLARLYPGRLGDLRALYRPYRLRCLSRLLPSPEALSSGLQRARVRARFARSHLPVRRDARSAVRQPAAPIDVSRASRRRHRRRAAVMPAAIWLAILTALGTLAGCD